MDAQTKFRMRKVQLKCKRTNNNTELQSMMDKAKHIARSADEKDIMQTMQHLMQDMQTGSSQDKSAKFTDFLQNMNFNQQNTIRKALQSVDTQHVAQFDKALKQIAQNKLTKSQKRNRRRRKKKQQTMTQSRIRITERLPDIDYSQYGLE